MNKGAMKEKILDKNSKGFGLSLVLISLLMIFSLILFPYKYNPIYLLEVALMSVIGFAATFVILLWILMITLNYYLDVEIKWFSLRRVIMLGVFIFTSLLLVSIIMHDVGMRYKFTEVYSFSDYWSNTAMDSFRDVMKQPWDERVTFGQMIRFNGFFLPILLWALGGFWWNGIITIIVLALIVMYSFYVLVTDEYTILLSKLMFWRNDNDMVKVKQQTSGIDLNQSTEEFELNFNSIKNEVDTNEKLELIERVRKNMNKKNYEELSTKIADEKQKLIDLRKRVVEKIQQGKNEQLSKSRVSDSHRQEIMASLGYTTYSSLKAKMERNEAQAKATEPFTYTKPETYVEETKIEENVELINDGYKTTEQSLNVNEETLVDSFVEDMLDGFDPTMELPLLENYSEIFEDEEKLADEINKTLETILQLEDELEEKETTGEIVIEGLEQEITVEDYLSIPEVIAKSGELELDVNPVVEEQTAVVGNQQELIIEQQQDTTNDSEYSSIKVEETNNEAINLIAETPRTHFEEDFNEQEIAQGTEVAYNFLEGNTAEDELDIESAKEQEEQEGFNEEVVEEIQNWCNPYVLPSTSILTTSATSFDNSKLVQEATDKASALNLTFQSFGVKAQVNSFEIGPTITMFKIAIEPGIRTTKVTNLEDNIKLTLGAEYIRIIAPIPGTSFIGIEVPNSVKKPVLFKTVYDETDASKDGIVISIGQDVSGKSLSFDLTKAPHLLVAGSTGSGKSVAINTILASILLRYKPTDVQLVLVDPKMVEFAPFHGVPHLLAEVITDANNANNALKAMVEEMENRYRQMASMGVKKIEELNDKLLSEGKDKVPYVVIIIDELADLMMVAAKEVEDSIMRITQKARAAGIHMVLATQRPSTEIITGTIKSNIPSRMAFTVASSIDSRTILGQVGAEKLIGMGDMLVSLYGQLPFRGQGSFISNEEVEDIAAFTKQQCSANYKIDIESLIEMGDPLHQTLISTNDPLYIAAKDTVLHYHKASTSMLQRHLNIGYNKAASIIETLEDEGVIGPAKGSKPREVLI